ncbi:PAS domain S-box protein [Luteibacter pinisoli]|uniref:histidine kinase n=1 Tax=Luteibacter pinisoli TaxID=2589080 RepID=A0A4Y5Z342_9GAMM|nr:PAS domain-containing sensor histidine kinase [Luteibacter pinisoli]QDE39800.1 PAS domain S-box protein [Luteibacter pinisoli]
MPPEPPVLPPVGDLYAAAPCGLVLTDPDGTIRHANETFCEWMGVELAGLVGGRRIQDLLTVGGRIFHQTHWVPLLQMQGSISEVKLELKRADGRTFPVVLNAVSRSHGAQVFHELAFFIAEDRHRYERELMHERAQAQQLLATHLEAQHALALSDARLRLAMESAHLHVWHVNPDTSLRCYDDSVSELLGYPNPQPVSAQRFLSHIEFADREREATALSEAMDATRGAYRCVFRLNGADGVQRTIRATGDAVFDQNGQFLRLVGVLQDISELSRQRAAAEERARFAEQMVGIVSHDLRNPLTAIKMGTQMLTNPALAPGKRDRMAEHIDASVDRARRLIDDLLDFTQAKIGSGLSVTPQSVDLHGLVGVAVNELRLSFQGRTLIQREEGMGECFADPGRLSQLLGNLVGNAMTYGDKERPVTITSRVDRDTFELEVHNWGTPIPEELLPVLFEPMMRGTAVANDQRSVGLGLFIVNDIVRAHRGQISVSSSLEAGTVFRTIFPRW